VRFLVRKIEKQPYIILLQCYFILSIIFFIRSFNFPLHDFAVGYFAGQLIDVGKLSSSLLYDIVKYNEYIWMQGFNNVYVDFYINSPFVASFFYPVSALFEPYESKIVFNFLSVIVFAYSIYNLFKTEQINKIYILIFPFIFITAIKNNILFGQMYLLLTAFLIQGYIAFKKDKNLLGALYWSTVIYLKIFPILLLPYLLFKRKWRALIVLLVCLFSIGIFSVYLNGIEIWTTFLFDILPNTKQNGTYINYAVNAQSIIVYLKFLFQYDSHFNPNAYYNNILIGKSLYFIIQIIIIAFTLQISITKRSNDFALFGCWLLFALLVQPRMVSYTKILFIIPFLVVIKNANNKWQIIFSIIAIAIAVNFSPKWLSRFSLIFQWPVLYFLIIFSILFYSIFVNRLNSKVLLFAILIALPPFITVFVGKKQIDYSSYVLSSKRHFCIYDYYIKDEKLTYNYLSINGKEFQNTDIDVFAIRYTDVVIDKNQIVYKGKQLTQSNDLKIKPSVINEKEIIYLSDKNSRRQAYTLRKLKIPD